MKLLAPIGLLLVFVGTWAYVIFAGFRRDASRVMSIGGGFLLACVALMVVTVSLQHLAPSLFVQRQGAESTQQPIVTDTQAEKRADNRTKAAEHLRDAGILLVAILIAFFVFGRLVLIITAIPVIGVPITAFPVLVLLFKLFIGIRLGLLGIGATDTAVNTVSWVMILAVPISFGVWLGRRPG